MDDKSLSTKVYLSLVLGCSPTSFLPAPPVSLWLDPFQKASTSLESSFVVVVVVGFSLGMFHKHELHTTESRCVRVNYFKSPA